MWQRSLQTDVHVLFRLYFQRLLFELDTTTDPVWHCLSSQYRWIKKIMTESYDEQIALVEGEDYFRRESCTFEIGSFAVFQNSKLIV